MKIQIITVTVYLTKVILAGNNNEYYFVLLFEQHNLYNLKIDNVLHFTSN